MEYKQKEFPWNYNLPSLIYDYLAIDALQSFTNFTKKKLCYRAFFSELLVKRFQFSSAIEDLRATVTEYSYHTEMVLLALYRHIQA